MAAYLIFELGQVADAAAIGEYVERGPAIVQQYGGRYLARGQQAEVVEGDHPPCAMVLIGPGGGVFRSAPVVASTCPLNHTSNGSREVANRPKAAPMSAPAK